MTPDLYELVTPRLRTMIQHELAVEVLLAVQDLFQVAVKHLDEPNYDRETLEAEERYLEAQLALQLKTCDNVLEAEMKQMGSERLRGEMSIKFDAAIRNLLDGTFGQDIERFSSQLSDCRKKLAAIRK